MESITLPVYNCQGKEVDSLKLNASVFDGEVNEAAVYQAVNAFRANQRAGLASTKTRGEVSGGGKKPWKQKGTGRARVGSTRSPLWRHGGVVFGPHPRSYYVALPKKIKTLALKSSLNAKLRENNIIVLDELTSGISKTKDAQGIFSKFNLALKEKTGRNNALLLLDKIDEKGLRALRNLSFLNVNAAIGTNAYEILSHKKLIITRKGLDALSGRLKK